MDYTQSPFLRSDDYSSEVADLRDNINELATDISQINITLTDDIRNVNERLNVYQNNIKQNVYTNKLEANVAEVNNAYIDDIYARNVKTNVLDVNTLNVASINNTILVNPHIENMDAVNGQIINAEIIDSVIVNGSGSFNSLNVNTVNVESGSIKRANISDSTLTNVVIDGFDLNNPRYLNVNNADFNVANFNNIYGVNADFDYIQRVNTDDVIATNIIVNGDARFHYLNANNANIRNITNTNISNATLSDVKVEGDLVLPESLIVNDINANIIKVEDLNATTISVQELTDVNLIHANNVSSDWGYIQNLAAHNLTLDVSDEPKETPYVLGYDANGKVFPAIAQGGGGGSVLLPADADYIYTDAQGLPLKGVVATDLNDSNALVKASLVAPFAEQTVGLVEQVNVLSNQTNELSEQTNDLSVQVNELMELMSAIDELKPNQTVDYFNSASPLDYTAITAFEKGKTSIKDKNNYTLVADGLLGFTGLKVDNNILHLDSTLSNFYLNKDLSYMFNGCSNFDGTGFDAIPDGTTNTAFMFANTKLKKPYQLPASVINSYNMYENVLFEITPGETIEGINDATYNINNNSVALDLNILNSPNVKFAVENTNRTLYNTNLNIINSRSGFSTSSGNVIFNGGDFYFDNAWIFSLGSVRNANITLKGNVQCGYSRIATFRDCEINAIEVTEWNIFNAAIFNGNVSIGENTPVKGMFGADIGWYDPFPNIIYPENRTNWAGLYYMANGYDQNLLNNILPTATNVDEMFYGFRNKKAINISNMLGLLNKDVTSLYRFQNGNAVYNSLTELKAVFPNAKNIGYSNLVKRYQNITEEEVAGFTDISGIKAYLPDGATNFNVPTLTTLENVFAGGINVNIVISNNCTFAPNVYSRSDNVFLTGDLSGIKNGYYLYPSANQWFGYPKNLESAPYMYDVAGFNEISEPIPNGLTNTVGMFNGCYNLTSIPSDIDLSNCTNASEMFNYCNNLVEITGVMDLSNCKSAYGMFDNCTNLTTVDFNFIKTLKPGAYIVKMFDNCPNLICNDINVFTNIPLGVNAERWFGGKLVSDVNTNNEVILSAINTINIDGNVNISLGTNVASNFELGVTKSLNVDIDITTAPSDSKYIYYLSAAKYNLIAKGTPTQDVFVRNLGYFVDDSYFEADNLSTARFDGGVQTFMENSRFVFTNVNNAYVYGDYPWGGPSIEMRNSIVELNNVGYLSIDVTLTDNVHLNQMPTNGFTFYSKGVIVDSAADINVLDINSFMYNDTSFVDNRLNINVLATNLEFRYITNTLDIYLNSIIANGKFIGDANNIIIHIPTNADLATGLNNGTYGSFPSENIIQY